MSDQQIGKKQNPSLKDSIQSPLLLNQSMKESIQGPYSAQNSPLKQGDIQPIKQEQAEDAPQHSRIVESAPSQPPDNLVITEQPRARDLNLKVDVIVEQPRHKIQEIRQTITSDPGSYRVKGSRRYRVMQACGAVCVLIGFVFIFALPPFLESIIKTQAIEQVVMGPENEGMWAHFPGDTDTVITRNFTFFKILNEDDYLLRHKKPKFQQISNFKIQELEDYLDITYLEDGNKVKVRDWLRFAEWPDSKNINSTVNIVNMGNIGYWSTLKVARPTLILQQGLALLFTNMEQAIVPTLLGTGINSQFLPNKTITIQSLLIPSQIEEENHDFLWEDPAFGLNNPENLGQWAAAAIQSFDNHQQAYQYSHSASALKNYFALSDTQTKNLMKQIYGYVKNLKHILIENHYCAKMNMSKCTGRFLAVAQMTDGWVSAKPPPVSTITPNDTICDNNNTCITKYPQLYAFEKNVYWGGKQPTTTIGFNRQQIEAWFDYNKTVTKGVNFNTAEDCLLHIGNLDRLWEWGTNYDNDEDESGMDKIRDRLKLDNSTQAKVVWEWLKYMAHQFVLQKQSNDKLGVANLFTQGFYEQFSLLKDRLQPFLLKNMIKKEIVECHLFFENTLEQQHGSSLVSQLCKTYDIHSEDFLDFIISTCEQNQGPSWQQLKQRGVSLSAMAYHCQINGGDNLGSMIHRAKVELDQKYNCKSTPNPYCSNFQLASKQWANSTITLDPPASLPSALTFNQWDSKVKSFEYGFFLGKFTNEQRADFPSFLIEDLFSLFTFEQWFSAPVMLKHFVDQDFSEAFLKYIRWFSISITLNGLTMNRTVRQILFGYEDEYLAQVKNTYPPFGGDPSAPSVIALNDLNLTNEQSTQTIVFKTGKDDFRDVYQNYQINGYRYLVNNYSWFTGNETKTGWKSPWAEQDYFYGTTAKIFAPNQFEANNMSLLIPQVQRYGSNFFYNESEPTERFGLTLYQAYLNKFIGEVAPHNDKYYQTIANVFNVTSIYGLPLYITKNHFMNCTQFLDQIEIYSQDMSIHYTEISHWDDTFIIVEPYTGVSFQSVIYLQNNIYHQPDFLYTYPRQFMHPIFSISRAGNLTEQKFHVLYDPLVMGLSFKAATVYIGIAIVLVFLVLLVVGTYCLRKIKKMEINDKKHSQLGISLQTVIRQDQHEEPSQRMVLEREEEE